MQEMVSDILPQVLGVKFEVSFNQMESNWALPSWNQLGYFATETVVDKCLE